MIEQTRALLGELGFDAERQNERSALVLLALLQLGPGAMWSAAANPLLRTVEIIGFIRDGYGRAYKPNTRETIRRQTLHQFVSAGLAVQNPDDPERPINSPNWCYQVDPSALDLIRNYGSSRWGVALAAYLENRPGLLEQYARARDLKQIPVTLADGTSIELTPGGQNVLIKEMVEQLCPRFAPGGTVLYIGDAGKDDPVYDEASLAEIGIKLNKHGKLPDLIVWLPEKNWLVLLEAAPSHGPVDEKRYAELTELFGNGNADLIFISCFATRAQWRKVASEIAWETEVWTADHPDHLVHYNGDKFLGPYAG